MREGWRQVSLGSLTEKIIKRAPTGDEEFHYIDISSVSREAKAISGTVSVNSSNAPGRARQIVQPGDILVSTVRPNLNAVARVPADLSMAIASTGFCVLREGADVAPGYLFALVRSSKFVEDMTLRATGSNYPAVTERILRDYKILLPPFEDQQRIVDLIGSLDVAVEAADELTESTSIAALELRRATFESLVAQYSMDTAGNMFNVLLGRQKSARQSVGDHVIPYIRAGNLSDGFLSLAVVQTMNFDPREQAKYCLQVGDVLIAEGGSVGQSAVWNGEVVGSVGFDKHVLRVRGVAGRSVGAYAFQWARWCYESGQFAAAATGITIKALGFDRAKKILVPAAPVPQQIEAMQNLTAADDCAAVAAEVADALRATRAELLSVLLVREHEISESYDIDTAVQLEPAA